MTSTINEAMTEDRKADMLKSYKYEMERYDAIRSEMEVKGYLRDMEREEERIKLYDLLGDCGIGMGQAAAEVESYGLEFYEENREISLRDMPPEMLAEREKQEKQAMEAEQKRKLAPDDLDDDMPF